MAFVRILNADRARSRDRRTRRADRCRRVAHVRHGRHVPPARHLLVGRPALPSARRRAADVVPRGQARTDSAGRHQRSGRALVVDRRRHVVLESRPADDSVLHLLLDVRLPARRRSDRGRPATAGRAASCSARRRAARRSTAKACSTKTAAVKSRRRSFPTAAATIRRTATNSPSSFKTACGECWPIRKTHTTTSR